MNISVPPPVLFRQLFLPMMHSLTQLIHFLVETAVLVGRESASKPAEMGNVQKKFSSRGAWKPDPKEAHKPRDPSEKTIKKGISEETIQESLQGGKKEINGYLSSCINGNEIGEGKPKDVESSVAGINSSTLLPANAAKLKTEGNELFKNGQFGEAMLKYSRAIESVLSSGEIHIFMYKFLYTMIGIFPEVIFKIPLSFF